MNSEIAANGAGGAGHPPSLHKYVATRARLGCLPSAHYSVPEITHAHAVVSCDLDHMYTCKCPTVAAALDPVATFT